MRKVKLRLLEDWKGHKMGEVVSVTPEDSMMLLKYGKAATIRNWPKDRMIRQRRMITK